MLSTNLVKTLESSLYQACWTHSQSSAFVLHRRPEIDRSKIDHKLSMGFRSGLCDGQSSGGICISCIARCVLIAGCLGSMSCWNVQFLPWNRTEDQQIFARQFLVCRYIDIGPLHHQSAQVHPPHWLRSTPTPLFSHRVWTPSFENTYLLIYWLVLDESHWFGKLVKRGVFFDK